MNITMERIAPPSPSPAALSPAALRFLRFHIDNMVTEWRWHFLGTQLRAQAEGISATIWRDDLEHLIRRGLLRQGVGCADVAVTDAGRDLVVDFPH